MSQQSQSFKNIANVSTTVSSSDGSINLTNTLLNAILGTDACRNNTSGTENTIVGTNALFESTGGSGIVAIGCYAGRSIISADGAVLIGDRVAPVLQAGCDSIIQGYAAGLNVVSAEGCVMIGQQCGTSLDSGNQGFLSETVALGSRAIVAGRGATTIGARSFANGDASVCLGYSNVHNAVGGVTLGCFNRNSSDGSIVIGQNHKSLSDNSVLIVAGSGAGQLNLQNILTSEVNPKSTLHDVSLAAPNGVLHLSGPTGIIMAGDLTTDKLFSSCISVIGRTTNGLTCTWNITVKPNQDATSSADLTMSSCNGTTVTFCDDFLPGVLNFTAQHRCRLLHHSSVQAGLIVVSTGTYCGLDGSDEATIDEAIPVVELSSHARDSRVFGVISRMEPVSPPSGGGCSSRIFRLGSLSFSIPRLDDDRLARVVVNSGGEGGILVCGVNGEITNGDLLVSSHLSGLAMRQGDDIVRSCTIAKSTCSFSFVHNTDVRLLGCVYMC